MFGLPDNFNTLKLMSDLTNNFNLEKELARLLNVSVRDFSAAMNELNEVQRVCFKCKRPLDLKDSLALDIIEHMSNLIEQKIDFESFKKQWRSSTVQYYCCQCLPQIRSERMRRLQCVNCGSNLDIKRTDSNVLFACNNCKREYEIIDMEYRQLKNLYSFAYLMLISEGKKHKSGAKFNKRRVSRKCQKERLLKATLKNLLRN